MGDSAAAPRLLHGFSYASAIPNQSKQGNPLHALGESISFGKFLPESEEAERFVQPGSVAQKKAFFEAHYKRIAAQKSAAQNGQTNDEDAKEDNLFSGDENAITAQSDGFGETRISVTTTPQPQMEIPLLKYNNSVSESKRKPDNFCLKESIRRKTWEVPCTPASRPLTSSPYLKKQSNAGIQRSRKKSSYVTDKEGSSSNSLRKLISSILIKESVFAPKKKDLSTANNTPTQENFNVNTVQKGRPQKEESGKEHRRLSCTLCFKARPLPEFYKERKSSVKMLITDKIPVPQPQTKVAIGIRNSNKKQGSTSVPPPKALKNLTKTKFIKESKVATPLLRVTLEPKPPNIWPSS